MKLSEMCGRPGNFAVVSTDGKLVACKMGSQCYVPAKRSSMKLVSTERRKGIVGYTLHTVEADAPTAFADPVDGTVLLGEAADRVVKGAGEMFGLELR